MRLLTVPEVPGIEGTIRLMDLRAISRITLIIDPAVTPAKVAEQYRLIRRGMLSQRHRSMSAKHLRLAAFVAGRPDEESWEDRMLAWNEAYPRSEYPGYEYKHRWNFSRDANQARQRLLHPEYHLPGNEVLEQLAPGGQNVS